MTLPDFLAPETREILMDCDYRVCAYETARYIRWLEARGDA